MTPRCHCGRFVSDMGCVLCTPLIVRAWLWIRREWRFYRSRRRIAQRARELFPRGVR